MPTSGGPGAIPGQATRSSTVSEFISNAYTALELAIKLAPLIPVPFVSSILASAQVVVDAANVSRTCAIAYFNTFAYAVLIYFCLQAHARQLAAVRRTGRVRSAADI
jgi:hypothetical protein